MFIKRNFIGTKLKTGVCEVKKGEFMMIYGARINLKTFHCQAENSLLKWVSTFDVERGCFRDFFLFHIKLKYSIDRDRKELEQWRYSG